MEKILVVMWIAIVLLVCLTIWLFLNPGALLAKLPYVPKSELEKVQAEAEAQVQQTRNESGRQSAEATRQIQKRQDQATSLAAEKMQIENSLANFQSKSDDFRGRVSALLLDALGHDEPAVRAWVAGAMVKLGNPNEDAISKLRELLRDDHEEVREAAHEALKELEPKEQEDQGGN